MATGLTKQRSDTNARSVPNQRDPRQRGLPSRRAPRVSSLRPSVSRPPHRAGPSTVDRDAHTHSPHLHPNEPVTSTSTPASNSCDSFQLLHYAASLLAENTNYKSDVERLRSTYTTERAILSRLWQLNPSIPVGFLMHLLLISQDRVERRARLEAVERACNSAKERVQVVEARESMLSCEETSSLRDQAHPLNRGSAPSRHDHRKGGLQRERTRAQGEIDLHEREMTEIRDKLDALERDEQEYWQMLSKSYGSAHSSEESEVVGRVPLLQDPLYIGIQPPLEVTFTNSSIEPTSNVITGEQDHEILPQDAASLPEIPDSPSISTIPVPPIPIPLILDSPPRTDEEGPHWRLSTTSNNTNPRSSAGESSLVGPSTPLDAANDILLPTIISPDMLEEAKFEMKVETPSLTSDSCQSSDRGGDGGPPVEHCQAVFQDNFSFPSFTIPPLAGPSLAPPQQEGTFLAPDESAFSLVSYSAATVGATPSLEVAATADGNCSDSGNNHRFKKLSRMLLNPLVVSTAPGEPKVDDLHAEKEGQAGASSILRSLLVPRRRTKSTTTPGSPRS